MVNPAHLFVVGQIDATGVPTGASLGGLTPAQYTKRLAIKAVTMPDGSKALRY